MNTEALFGLLGGCQLYASSASFMYIVARSNEFGPCSQRQSVVLGALWPGVVPILGALGFMLKMDRWLRPEDYR